jgi:hypothetical protein
MIPGAGTGYIKQVAFGVINLFKVRVIRHCFYAGLQGYHFIIAGHHGNGVMDEYLVISDLLFIDRAGNYKVMKQP